MSYSAKAFNRATTTTHARHGPEQNHEKAPFSILYNHELAVAYTVCWWAVNYCPGRPLSKLLARQPFKVC